MKLILKNLFTDGKVFLINKHNYNLAVSYNNVEKCTIINELKIKQVKSNRKIILEDDKVLYIKDGAIVVGYKGSPTPSYYDYFYPKHFICVTDKDEAIAIANEKLGYSRIVQ